MPEPTTDGDTQAQRNAKVADTFLQRWTRERAPLARRRFHARRQRLLRLRRARAERRRPSPGQGLFLQSSCIPAIHGDQMPEPVNRAAMPGRDADRATKQTVIRAAVNRVRHRRRGARES